jgi:hypothetical protein
MAEQDIFLSWSKPASKAAAETFREYLPQLFPSVKPWMSSADIAKGTGWFASISEQLARSRACLLLITPENVGSSWLYYEAGAVAYAFQGTRVFPYLIGVKTGEISPTPLGQYQATLFDRDDTKRLVRDLNRTLDAPIDETVLGSAFDGVWPKLQRKLSKIPLPKPDGSPESLPPPAPPTPPPDEPRITDDADILALLHGWMSEHYPKGDHTPPIKFADVDRDLNLPDGAAVRLLVPAAEKLGWKVETKGPSLVVFKRPRYSIA